MFLAGGGDESCAAAPLEPETKIKSGYNVGPLRPGLLMVYMMPWKKLLERRKRQLSCSLLRGARMSGRTRSGARFSWGQTRRECGRQSSASIRLSRRLLWLQIRLRGLMEAKQGRRRRRLDLQPRRRLVPPPILRNRQSLRLCNYGMLCKPCRPAPGKGC